MSFKGSRSRFFSRIGTPGRACSSAAVKPWRSPTIGIRRPHAAPSSAQTYGRSSAQGVMSTTSSSASCREAKMSSSKSAPTSIWASSRNGTAPHAAIAPAICRATHVSAPLWLMNTRCRSSSLVTGFYEQPVNRRHRSLVGFRDGDGAAANRRRRRTRHRPPRERIAVRVRTRPVAAESEKREDAPEQSQHDGLRSYCGRLNNPPYTALPSTWPCIAFITFARVSNASAVGCTSIFVSSA